MSKSLATEAGDYRQDEAGKILETEDGQPIELESGGAGSGSGGRVKSGERAAPEAAPVPDQTEGDPWDPILDAARRAGDPAAMARRLTQFATVLVERGALARVEHVLDEAQGCAGVDQETLDHIARLLAALGRFGAAREVWAALDLPPPPGFAALSGAGAAPLPALLAALIPGAQFGPQTGDTDWRLKATVFEALAASLARSQQIDPALLQPEAVLTGGGIDRLRAALEGRFVPDTDVMRDLALLRLALLARPPVA